MRENIILIGPIGAGKTTIAELLAQRLGMSLCSMDVVRWDYYAEIGFDQEKSDRLRAEGGLEAVVPYWKPFEVHAVERALSDFPSDHVVEFGAGHSVYEDAALFERAQKALAPFKNVVLLLPSPDVEESLSVLEARFLAEEPDAPIEIINGVNRGFLEHPSNTTLATLTVYTKGKTPEETVNEIIGQLRA